MVTVKTKDCAVVEEKVNDVLFSLCSKTLFGITCLIGLWGVVCIVSGMVAVGGPVALMSALIAAI